VPLSRCGGGALGLTDGRSDGARTLARSGRLLGDAVESGSSIALETRIRVLDVPSSPARIDATR
jgi:hypothetical protein